MSGLTDLQAQVAALVAVDAQVISFVQGLQTQITTLQATIAQGGDNDADVEAQAQALGAQVASLSALVNPTTSTGTGS